MMAKTRPNKPTIVQKYGGSSLADPDCLRRVAENIVARKDKGVHLLVVVSAMGKTTDQFDKLAHEVSSNPERREMDMLLSVGERISIALLALAINEIGSYKAVSYTGSQIGLITDDNHTQARILEIKGYRLKEALEDDKIVIVAGFQGVSLNREITTLGRGGSDTTAVALAAALQAEQCEIMSDVDGIYSADPKKIPTARIIPRLDYDTALEMAAAGAKMLHKTSVEFAKRHRIKLSLGSSLSGRMGTIVTDESLSRGCVSAVVEDRDVVVVSFTAESEQNDEIPILLSRLKVQPKMWQCTPDGGLVALGKEFADRFLEELREIASVRFVDRQCALLTIIGAGVGLGSGPSEQLLVDLKKQKVNPLAVETSELYLKVLVSNERSDQLARRIHDMFLPDSPQKPVPDSR